MGPAAFRFHVGPESGPQGSSPAGSSPFRAKRLGRADSDGFYNIKPEYTAGSSPFRVAKRLGRARAGSERSGRQERTTRTGPGRVRLVARARSRRFARPSLFRPSESLSPTRFVGGGGGRALLTSPQKSRPPQSSRPLKAHVPSKLTPPSELTSPSEPPRGGAHRPGGRG